MSKKATPRKLAATEAGATLRTLRISPRKLNLIAGMIRGKHVSDALDHLMFSKKRSAKAVYDLVVSAISNAENNHGLDMDNLYVAEAYVGKSLIMKRFMARARGRGSRIIKPFSRISVVLREQRDQA